MIRKIWILGCFLLPYLAIGQTWQDSVEVFRKEWQDYKTLQSEKLEIQKDKLTNQLTAFENRFSGFENKHYWWLTVLSFFGLGAITGLIGGYIGAKKLVENRLMKLFEEENGKMVQHFHNIGLESRLKATTKIASLTPKDEDTSINVSLVVSWGFKRVMPVEIENQFLPLKEEPDCIFINNKSGKFPLGLIDEYMQHYPSSAIFYYGSVRLAEGLVDKVGSANFKTQVPGNLLNALKFKEK